VDRQLRFSPAAFVTVVCWGTSFVATRVALTWLTPAALVTSRLVLGLATLLAIARIGRSVRRLDPQDRLRCLLLGAILAGHLLLQNSGLLRTTATHTGWIIGFIPAMIALGSVVLLGERLAPRGWCGIALGAAGVALVCLSSGLRFSAATVGDLMQLLSCVTWTVFTLLSVRPIVHSGALPVTIWTIGVAAVIAALIETTGLLNPDAAVRGGQWSVGPATAGPLLAVVFLGAVSSGAAYVLWNVAIRSIGSSATGAYLYLEPFATLLAAQIVLGERLTWMGVCGGIVVLGGVALVGPARRPARTAPTAGPAPATDGPQRQ